MFALMINGKKSINKWSNDGKFIQKFCSIYELRTIEWLNAKIDRNIINRYFFERIGIDIDQDIIIKHRSKKCFV